MSTQLEQLKQTWSKLGADDPFWAVVSHDNKRNGKWDVESFLETGRANVQYYHQLMALHAAAPEHFDSVLDFGCGVGRLSLAWSERADRVVGVDISQSMIENAHKLADGRSNIEFKVNHAENLSCFTDDQFTLVCSHICLQHMPWELAKEYIKEFGRVCKPDGWVAFQLPAGLANPSRHRIAGLRRWIIDHLPLGLGQGYRRWKHGTDAVFEMHYTEPEEVRDTAHLAGLEEIHRQPDQAAGPEAMSFIYIFRKPARRVDGLKRSVAAGVAV